jgi:hypothetical protein
MNRFLLTTSLLLTFSTFVFAQNKINSVRQRTDLADLVVEGHVIETKAFWNADNNKIFTSNLIAISTIFKGKIVGERIEVITEGGVVGNQFSIAVDKPKFTTGLEGIFFCKSRENLSSLGITPNHPFSPATSDCVIQYHFEDFNPPASDLSGSYKNIPSEIWDNIVLSSRAPVQHIKQRKIEDYLKRAFFIKGYTSEFLGEKYIYYTFENVSVSNNFQSITFDIYAHASENGLSFGKANVFFTYSTDVFGSNIVSNSNISASKGITIANSAYTLATTDHSTNVVKLEVTSSFSSPDATLYSLTTVPVQFCHIELDIADFSALANISFDQFQMTGNSWYYDGGYVPFDRVNVETPINAAVFDTSVIISYNFDNISVTENGSDTFLEFDVVAFSNVEWTRLGQADVFIGYNGDAFGPSPELLYELTPEMQSLGYFSSTGDYPGFFKELYIVQFGEDSLKYMTLSTSPKQLAHCKLKIKDCSQRAGLKYSRVYMDGQQAYFIEAPVNYALYGFGEDDFGEFNQYICLDSTPIITDIYPLLLKAGVSDTLTIKGLFLKQSSLDNGTVYFRNSETPYSPVYSPSHATDIIEYTDTLIRVYVPSDFDMSAAGSAASGKIQVVNALSKSAESDKEIEIIYSLANIRDGSDYAHQISFVNADGVNGGYDWIMDDELLNENPDDCINSALSTWTCNTGINWHLNSSDVVVLDQAEFDEKSTIILASDTAGTAYAYTSLAGRAIECADDISMAIWVVNDIDIFFSKNYTFQFDCNVIDTSGGKVDFYETLIHELSHAHMLQHVFDDSSVIFPYSTAKYPNSFDVAGGRKAIDFSLSWAEGGFCPPKHDTISCTIAVNDIAVYDTYVKVFPNPFNDALNLEFQTLPEDKFYISLSSTTGTRLFESTVENPSQQDVFTISSRDVSNLPTGIYFLTVKSSKGIYTHKLIKN